MLRATLAILVPFTLLPDQAKARQWSPQQQEVLQAIEECWDLWMDGVERGTPDPWIDNCSAQNATYWTAADGAPKTAEAYLRRNWGGESGVDLQWVDLRPLYIDVRGDVAVIHFYAYWRFPGPALAETKRTEVWRLENGRWRQWIGHATAVQR